MGIKEELAEMGGCRSFLALSPATELQVVVTDTIDYILKKLKEGCIYISLNKPVELVEEQLKTKGVSLDRIYLIDCTTGRIARAPKRRNVAYVSRPYNLTDISIRIAQFARDIKNSGFVLVDSLDVLRMYTRPEVMLQFIHSLASLPVKYGLKLIVFGSVETFRTEMGSFAQYFDKVLQVSPVELRKVRPVKLPT